MVHTTQSSDVQLHIQRLRGQDAGLCRPSNDMKFQFRPNVSVYLHNWHHNNRRKGSKPTPVCIPAPKTKNTNSIYWIVGVIMGHAWMATPYGERRITAIPFRVGVTLPLMSRHKPKIPHSADWEQRHLRYSEQSTAKKECARENAIKLRSVTDSLLLFE